MGYIPYIVIMKKAIKLVLKEGTTFDVYFSDGRVKRYDILSLADKFPQLLDLKDRNLFLKGHILGWSGVVWNDELDVDCDTVYEEGIDVTDEYDDVIVVTIGYNIKQLRIEKNLTQEELAKLIGMDQADLSKLEKGLMNPSIKTLTRVANGLDSKISITIQ